MATIEIRDVLDNETGKTIFPRTHVDAVIGLKDSSFFEKVQDGLDPTKFSVKLKSEYTGLWAEGWVASGEVGSGSGGGGTVEHLNDIGDVTIDSGTLAAGQGIVWDATAGKWKNAVIGGTYILPIASSSTLGGVRIGTGLSIDPATGVLSAAAGPSVVVDSELSTTSVNPVQNRVITNALGLKADASVTCFVGEIVETV